MMGEIRVRGTEVYMEGYEPRTGGKIAGVKKRKNMYSK